MHHTFIILLSASLHMLSPASRGILLLIKMKHKTDILDLFKRVILQSDTFFGVSYHPFSPHQSRKLLELVASELDCGEDIAGCLEEREAQDIMVSSLAVTAATNTVG